MAIIKTSTKSDGTTQVTQEHKGCVVKTRTYTASRNHSDTLDYTDIRTAEVTEALIYLGRRVPADHDGWLWIGSRYYKPGDEIPMEDRLSWVDCTNLFADRCGYMLRPEVDVHFTLLIPGFVDDYEAWQAHHAKVAQDLDALRKANEERDQKLREERERNRPVKGKRMVVVKGRKVPVGTEGTVAFISDDGAVLLKPHDKWQDRKANGVWVKSAYLKAL